MQTSNDPGDESVDDFVPPQTFHYFLRSELHRVKIATSVMSFPMLLNVLCLFNGASARNRVIPSSCMAYMQLCKLRMLSTSRGIGLCHGQTFWVGQEKVSNLLQSVTLSIAISWSSAVTISQCFNIFLNNKIIKRESGRERERERERKG